ncbi:ATP-binding protein [Oleiharenicola lentus]|uniref:ATP-binding protein n=1 Tax=Oleiharenicola lentus TaxID=2508720 RepID=UPI001C555A5E|nr:ATP-binding protein [Oleiharenicola lentus]
MQILVGFSLVGSVGAAAADPFVPRYADPMHESWRWRSYPELSGLAANCMVQAPDGVVWFGTNETIWSYDGLDWKNHNALVFHGGPVNAMAVEPAGSVLAVGYWGMQRYQAGQWNWAWQRTGRMFGDFRKVIVDAQGTVWVASLWGLLEIRDGRARLHTSSAQAARVPVDRTVSDVEKVTIPEKVTAHISASRRAGELALSDLTSDGQGGLWMVADEGEVLHYSPAAGDEAWRVYTAKDGLKPGRRPSVLRLRDGAIWVVYGLDSGHLNVFDGSRWTARPLSAEGAPGDCNNLLQTRDGTVWVSARYQVAAWRDGRWHSYEKPAVPIPTAWSFLCEGIDGALWIGGPSTEIQRVDYDTGRWVTLLDLMFQWQGPDGAEWFLHRDGRVVRHLAGRWECYDAGDGLPDAPVALLGTRQDEVWVAGSHGGEAAMARYRGDGRWERMVQTEFAWGVDWRGVLEASDGSLWFAATVDSRAPERHKAGLLQYRGGRWIHHHQPGRAPTGANDDDPATLLPATQRPEPVGKFSSLAESADGRIWTGRNLLAVYDGRRWERTHAPKGMNFGQVDAMFTTRDREFWVGSRQFGAFRYDGREWRSYLQKGGLVANGIRGFTQTEDRTVWAATDHDISRFDGHAWTPGGFPAEFVLPHDGGSLRAGRNGRIWINHFPAEWMWRAWSRAPAPGRKPAGEDFRTIAHKFTGPPPETTFTLAPERVPPPGNLSVAWAGRSPWRSPEEARLQFSHRLDGGAWSVFSTETGRALFALTPGQHRLEVRARDRDFNVDPTPAVLEFTVLPPVWRQPWFLAMIALAGGLVAVLTGRLIGQQLRLRRVNRELAKEIAEHRQAEETLRTKEEYFQNLIEHSSDLISVLTVDGQIRYQSPAASRVLLRPAGTPVSADIYELIHPEDQAAVRATIARAAATDEPTAVEFRVRTFDDQWRVLQSLGRRLPAAEGEPLVVVNSRDITEVQQLEAQFRQSQKMEALGQLAGGVAHDFNNLLTVITGNAGLLQSGLAGHGENAPLLRDIRAAAERAAALTRQLLVFSRQEKAQKRDVELGPLVANLGKLLRRLITEEVSIEITASAEPVWLRADPGMIEQVVLNLAINARDAMSRGGRLQIHSRPARDAELPAGVCPPGAVLEVTDTGTGIAPEVLPKIFEPFFTTKEVGKGTGLGLATVFGIVQQHQGRIEVSSQLGQGTTFRVYLPRVAAAVTRQAAKTETVGRGRGETILLVEDEPAVRDVVFRALSGQGYRVLVAPDGLSAMELWAARRNEIHLLLTDLVMPGGVSGLQIARRMVAENPALKVICSSGYGLEKTETDHLDQGFVFLPKPYEMDELHRAVRVALDKRVPS